MKDKHLTSISDFQRYFDSLYGSLNSERNWQDIYGYLARTTGYLTRSTIKGSPKTQDFCRAISWLFALSNKLEVNLEECLLRKYPGICPYCIEISCCCIRTGKTPLKEMPAHKIIEERAVQYKVLNNYRTKGYSFSETVEILSKIYSANDAIWHFSGPWMTCSKLFEEVAELHEAISKNLVNEKPKENVNEEFADVLAWLLTAWNSCFRDKSLDDELISYFYQDCPVCRSLPCACSSSDSRIQGLVDAEKFKELRLLFEELEELSPDAHSEVSDLVESLRCVEKTHDEAVANSTVKSAKQTYDMLASTLEKTDSVVKKLSSISGALTNLFS